MNRTALDELRRMLESDSAVLVGDAMEGHLRPERGPTGSAAAVVRPSSVDEVRAVVRWARTHRTRLVPQGANTGLVGASSPDSSADLVLSLERLSAAPDIDPDGRTATVDAGVLLSTLNDAARPFGLELPIDLGADPSIGGMVATNTGGSRMIRHGDMRRHVLGLEAVIADAECSTIGPPGALRKDNTGPSFEQLLIGSGGALGIITKVVVELTPRPTGRSVAWIAPVDAEGAVSALVALEGAVGSRLAAFEVVSSTALSAALEVSGGSAPFDPLPELVVLVEVVGEARDVEGDLVAALDGCARAGWIDDAVVVPPQHAWDLRHAVTEGLRHRGVVTGFDLSVPRSSLPRFRAAALALVDGWHDAQLADFGHWGDGGIHCNVVWQPGHAPTERRLAERRAEMFELVDRFGGSFSAEHGIGPVNAAAWLERTSPVERAVLRSVKAVVDPLGVLGHAGLPY